MVRAGAVDVGAGTAEFVPAAEFRTALRRFLQRAESIAARAGLTPQRYDLLLMIASRGEVRVTELCELLQLRQSAVAELVKRSEEAGLVVRRQSDEDGRVWLLRLTREGRERFLEAFRALREERKAFVLSFRELDRRFQAERH